MTEKQAYKILTNTPIRAKENHTEYSKALHMALDALEKQIPCKVEEGNKDWFYCNKCDNFVSLSANYCDFCGQALLWEGDIE